MSDEAVVKRLVSKGFKVVDATLSPYNLSYERKLQRRNNHRLWNVFVKRYVDTRFEVRVHVIRN